jgi:hypothetical protein
MGVTRPRGSLQKRVARVAAAQEPVLQSALAAFLISQFAWGHFSGQLVQKIAELAVADINAAKETNGKFQDLNGLAQVGNKGRLSNNVHRDIMRQVSSQSKLPQALEVVLPFSRNLGLQAQTLFLPHEVFASIYHNYKNTWEKTILPDANRLQEFWEANEGHQNMENHPLRLVPNWKEKCIPIGMHGDEVPVTGKGKCWSKSMLTFQWLSLIGDGGTTDKLVWIWAAFDKLLKPGEQGTLQKFWAVMVWSFTWLLKGLWPSHDWMGVE